MEGDDLRCSFRVRVPSVRKNQKQEGERRLTSQNMLPSRDNDTMLSFCFFETDRGLLSGFCVVGVCEES